ncbi:hypothetical protein JTE90_007970 [Oedothorax gibbosus]|uniref:Uncharacterized protein n=1 Tax=Oedothorax gibbosus TaxID=931172 RepID=A0AAV6UMP2_9ARAC|nr:hypothetical protein JTE90_007970 [Oedothorax gibbosus]
MSDRKTSKAVLVSSDEEDFVPLKRKMKSSGEVSKKGKRNLKVDLNLGEAAVPRVALPPYSIYLGSDILLEVKPFKKEFYLGFSKNVDGEVKNRFNVNIKMIRTVKRAIDAVIEHLEANNFEM